MRLHPLLVAGLLSSPAFALDGGVPDAGYRAHIRQWNIPKILSVIDVPGVQVADGVPLTLSAVTTGLPLQEIYDDLNRQFLKAGLYIPPVERTKNISSNPILVGLDTKSLVTYVAFFTANPDHTTTVTMGVGLGAEVKQPGVPDWAPIFPGAKDLATTRGEQMSTATYTTTAKEEDVRSFYDRVAPTGGFQKVEPDVYASGSTQLRVTYRKTKEGGTAVFVARSHYVPLPKP